jgi:hypothetical protein
VPDQPGLAAASREAAFQPRCTGLPGPIRFASLLQ